MKEKIRYLRKLNNLTLKQIADKIGITLSAYSNYEQGIREPSIEIIKKICLVFDVSADYLLGLEDETGAKIVNDGIYLNNVSNINNSFNDICINKK